MLRGAPSSHRLACVVLNLSRRLREALRGLSDVCVWGGGTGGKENIVRGKERKGNACTDLFFLRYWLLLLLLCEKGCLACVRACVCLGGGRCAR